MSVSHPKKLYSPGWYHSPRGRAFQASSTRRERLVPCRDRKPSGRVCLDRRAPASHQSLRRSRDRLSSIVPANSSPYRVAGCVQTRQLRARSDDQYNERLKNPRRKDPTAVLASASGKLLHARARLQAHVGAARATTPALRQTCRNRLRDVAQNGYRFLVLSLKDMRRTRGFRGMRSPVRELKAIDRFAQRKLRHVSDAHSLAGGADVIPKWFATNCIVRHISQAHRARVVLHVEKLLKLGGIGAGVNASPNGVGQLGRGGGQLRANALFDQAAKRRATYPRWPTSPRETIPSHRCRL